jgi:hypothetical protein
VQQHAAFEVGDGACANTRFFAAKAERMFCVASMRERKKVT